MIKQFAVLYLTLIIHIDSTDLTLLVRVLENYNSYFEAVFAIAFWFASLTKNTLLSL